MVFFCAAILQQQWHHRLMSCWSECISIAISAIDLCYTPLDCSNWIFSLSALFLLPLNTYNVVSSSAFDFATTSLFIFAAYAGGHLYVYSSILLMCFVCVYFCDMCFCLYVLVIFYIFFFFLYWSDWFIVLSWVYLLHVSFSLLSTALYSLHNL